VGEEVDGSGLSHFLLFGVKDRETEGAPREFGGERLSIVFDFEGQMLALRPSGKERRGGNE
jgi:hypothetical protein